MDGRLGDYRQWNGKCGNASRFGRTVGRLDSVGRYDVMARSFARQTVLTDREVWRLITHQHENVAFNAGTSFCWNRTEVEGA